MQSCKCGGSKKATVLCFIALCAVVANKRDGDGLNFLVCFKSNRIRCCVGFNFKFTPKVHDVLILI